MVEYEATVASETVNLDYNFKFKLVLHTEILVDLMSNDPDRKQAALKKACDFASKGMLKMETFHCVVCDQSATGFERISQLIPQQGPPIIREVAVIPACDKPECLAPIRQQLHVVMQDTRPEEVSGDSPKRTFLASCGQCLKKEEKVGDMKCCSRCHAAFYCNKDCQTSAWKAHKKVCKGVPSQTSEYFLADENGTLQSRENFIK